FRLELGDQPGIPHQAAFAQFVITGNARGNALRLDVDPGRGRNGSYREYFHSWSYDGKHWHPIRWQGNGFTFPEFTEDVVYFGNQVPMSYENLVELIEQWKKSPWVTVKIVGKSFEGRNLYRLEVTDPESPHPREDRWVHYAANQHGGEGNAQWRIAGMIDWALSAEAADFRSRSICHFVPMMSPDSPSHGWMRANAEGTDMNRSYLSTGSDSKAQTTEPYWWQKDFEKIMASTSPVTDIWSCHTWGGMVDILYNEGPEIGKTIGPVSQFGKLLDRLDADDLVNPIRGKEGGARTKWSTGPHDQFGITAFLCEGSGGIDTKSNNKQSGAVILRALSQYYKGTRK
ncbi:MAG: hypothetical protein HQ581_01585, partial [Planctomycetes bacterium]|nr:hypothetical protein [Planctomycetota bacterium]